MVRPEDVTACLITRGDVDLGPILETLPYPNVILWSGERDSDDAYGMYVRYALAAEAPTDVIYVQDDDCIFERHEELMQAYVPGQIVSTYGHGENSDGLDDFVLMHGGAIMDKDLAPAAFERYLEHWPRDEGFYREADIIVGGLTPFTHVHLPFQIRYEIAAWPTRMCHQPWQRDLKHKVANQVRQVRELVAA